MPNCVACNLFDVLGYSWTSAATKPIFWVERLLWSRPPPLVFAVESIALGQAHLRPCNQRIEKEIHVESWIKGQLPKIYTNIPPSWGI